MKKGIIITVISIIFLAVVAGCNNPESTEVAAVDQAILVVSFGTSYNESRNITIGGVESAISEQFPDYEVRRAFTSQIIIDILDERDGIDIDNVTEALEKLADDGVKTLIVQPTHLMHGYEHDDLIEELEKFEDKFDHLAVGEPLLTSDEDVEAVIECITSRTASYVNDSTTIVFMGHGTEHEANGVYASLQKEITDAEYSHYLIGTVEAEPGLDDIMDDVKDAGYTGVVLEPLMVVAGDHANNDMAGDEEDSWKSAFEAEGIKVQCILQGLGQFNEIQDIYISHVQDAIDGLE